MSPNGRGWTELTPARVLIAEMIRRYWVLGIECTYLEVQKLGWFLERTIQALGIADPLKLQFQADKYALILTAYAICSMRSTVLICTATNA